MKKTSNISKNTSVRGLEENYYPSGNGIDRVFFTAKPGVNLDVLYRTVKKSPELTAALLAIVEDVMADGWKLEGFDSNKKKAEKFIDTSNFYKNMANWVLDTLITGNGYDLKLTMNESELKSLIKEASVQLMKELKLKAENKTDVFEVLSQQATAPKDLQILKSSTIKINYDETGLVQTFQQEIGGRKRVYYPKDIMHLSLLNVGGEPYGFTPIEPLLSDIATLIFAKEFAGSYFENDGVPHFLFQMPEDAPDSPNYKKLKQELKELKQKAQKFRNLVVTGKIDVKELQKFNKDMEFSNLIAHFTQIILIAVGVPSYRINWTMGSKQIGGEVNRAFEGYYKKISFLQKLIEEKLNKELFMPHFKVTFKFNRAYKIDEMREAQIVQILTQAQLVTKEEAREMMGLEPEMPAGTMPMSQGDQTLINFEQDKRNGQGRENNPQKPDANQDNRTKDATLIDDLSKSLENRKLYIAEKTVKDSQFNYKKLSDDVKTELNILKEQFKQEMENTKEQFNKQSETQVKQLASILEESVKAMSKKSNIPDYVEVNSFMRFRLIVERYVGDGMFHQAKVLYQVDGRSIIMFFADGQWKYRCEVQPDDLEKFIKENLTFGVRIN